jgi:hypothetical protein
MGPVRTRNGHRNIDATSLDSDYNAFGYDPIGLVAHLASHFYGPEWRPATYDHIPHLVGKPGHRQAPRYGPPAPHQVPHLPTEFQPRPPPEYYGRPCPPYLRAPANFHPNTFAALSFVRVCIVSCAVGIPIDRIFSVLENKRTRNVQGGTWKTRAWIVKPESSQR